ncbi:hypothetical protein P4C99_08090 [Pontiellaceae bacterium B1224]|nr:hypothetical protein [Pontiellaceae bacterium B1224]
MQFYKRISIFTVMLLALVSPRESAAASPPPPGGPPAPILTGIFISGSATVDEETSAQYECSGKYSDGTTAAISASWSVSSSNSSIDTSGLFTAGNVSSEEVAVITATYGAYTVSMDVTVTYIAPVLSSLEISGPATLDEETSGHQYSCIARYSDGSILSVLPAWSVSSTIASINTAGLLTAGDINADQNVTVTASFGGISSEYTVSIKQVAAIVLTGITIEGTIAMDEGTSVQLNCVGQYSDDSTALVTPAWSEGSTASSISSSGLLSAGGVNADKSITVTASFQGFSDTHVVLIRDIPGILESIEISGPSSLEEGGAGQYSCVATYSDGTSKPISPSWSENSSYASFSSAGLLSAGDVTSDQSLTVSASYQGKSDSMPVTILYQEPVLFSIAVSGATEVLEGYSADYVCQATYSDGTTVDVNPVWTVNSSFAQINAAGTLTGLDVVKDEPVTVSASFGGLTESMAVTVKYELQQVVLTGLAIVGPGEVEELGSVTLTCQASYSDGSVATVSPVWTEDSPQASIDSAGMLAAGNVDADDAVTVTASFGGASTSREIEIWMVGTRVVYPLSGFEGKTVKAELYDLNADEWHDLGQLDSPEELVIQDVVPDQWYWISVQESNTTSNVWNEVHAEWLNM